MQAVYILSAVRTPIGKFGGALASCTAADIGVVAAMAAMERAGVRPEQIEAALRNAGIGQVEIHEIGPSLEDVFVSLSEKHAQEHRTGQSKKAA